MGEGGGDENFGGLSSKGRAKKGGQISGSLNKKRE